MRVALVVVLLCLAACASENLALAPPPGVDLSGRWKLNEADSDDPQRLVMSQLGDPGATKSPGQGGQGGQGGGRGGGRGGRGGGGGGGGFPPGGAGGPSMPAVGMLSEGLRWPGKNLEIKQVAGVVAITSAGIAEVYQPVAGAKRRLHRKPPADDDPRQGRDMRARDRGDGPPPICGWDDKTLVVQSGNPDDDHPPFEQRYSVSDDGQRLIEVVGFKGGRSAGFTISRVWDREAQSSDTPKSDGPKGDAPKGDAPKGDASKGDVPKGDASKGDVPKGDAPKGDAPRLPPGSTNRALPGVPLNGQ